jgi:hypothetical protein
VRQHSPTEQIHTKESLWQLLCRLPCLGCPDRCDWFRSRLLLWYSYFARSSSFWVRRRQTVRDDTFHLPDRAVGRLDHMADLLVLLAVIASFGGSLVGLAWLATRVRRRGTGGGYSLMGPFDDIWNPGALRARMEIEIHDERAAPSPSPGDRLI